MKRRNEEFLRDVVYRFLREEGLETPLNEHRAVRAWPEVAGEMVARYTGDVQIRRSILYVKITRPALRQDLSMQHTELKNRINQKIGAQVLQDIVFY